MVFKDQEAPKESPWDGLKEMARQNQEQVRRELKEIVMLIEQSQLEVNKLTQRNASITSQLQQVQGQFDSMPRADIRMAYDSALDAQQRLFVMRGQLDKLQSDKQNKEIYLNLLDRVLQTLESSPAQPSRQKGFSPSTVNTVEMIIQAQESERQKLARQMHDGPAQALSNFILQTEIAMRLFDLDQAKAKEELVTLKAAATTTFQKVRDFIFNLRPMMLDDLGLVPTLTRYIEATKDQTGIDMRITSSGIEQRLEPYLEVMIFRAVQELVGNAVRHSQAAQIRVQLDVTEGNVRLSAEDNGRGFSVETLAEHTGMGIKLIKERVEMLGGEITIDSVIGQGTRVVFLVPMTKTKVFA